ncbi:unnamed protein product [Brassica oleracea]
MRLVKCWFCSSTIYRSEDCGGAVVDWLLETVAIPRPQKLSHLYNYGPEDRQLSLLLTEFLQSVALLGALLFFIGMKNSTMTSSKQNQRSQA